jgi:aminoglycoside 3-N-acetyltransferase
MLGERSPLARIYALGGDVLLLGVNHGSNTSLHLAEYRVPHPQTAPLGAAVLVRGGARKWIWWDDVAVDESDFEVLGADLDESGIVRVGQVGSARCRLMPQRAAVDFAVGWFVANRKPN